MADLAMQALGPHGRSWPSACKAKLRSMLLACPCLWKHQLASNFDKAAPDKAAAGSWVGTKAAALQQEHSQLCGVLVLKGLASPD